MLERGYILPVGTMLENAERIVCDVLVVGAGIAGMTAALAIDPKLKVVLASKSTGSESSTYKAQGGMAAAVGEDDSPELHAVDTLRVGQGLCRKEAVEVMTGAGPSSIDFLQSLGADFNRRGEGLYLTMEGGHSRRRIVHYYDYTGRHIYETLWQAVTWQDNVRMLEDCCLVDILTGDGVVQGAVLFQFGRLLVVESRAVVIATGGYAGLYARSTNSAAACGDGIAAAYRAGAVIADMEFVQFHPTAFTTFAGEVFLLTEALRGEGAVLLNNAGERFMPAYHPDGDLAPRDEVSRAITREMNGAGTNHVLLDARHLGAEYLTDRFRQVYAKLAEDGYYLERDPVPVSPAAHYTIGGIRTDLWGKTSLAGLFACGEAAASGVHGGNRLASNSLLEGIVFGRRAAQAINEGFSQGVSAGAGRFTTEFCGGYGGAVVELGRKLEQVAGVARCGEEIAALLQELRQAKTFSTCREINLIGCQTINALQLAELLLEAALARRESRGTHYRVDYPEKDDVYFRKHIIQRWGSEVSME